MFIDKKSINNKSLNYFFKTNKSKTIKLSRIKKVEFI
jgi:hypothetical protein